MTVLTQMVFFGLGCVVGWYARRVFRWAKDKKVNISITKEKP